MDFPSFSESLSQTLAALGLPTTLLDAVNPGARSMLWSGLLKALEVSETPTQGRDVPPVSRPAGVGSAATLRAPLPFTRQPLAQPRAPQEQSGWLDLSDYLAGWHQNVRLALWVAAEALETLRAAPDAEDYRLLFSEQCRCIGQWYSELEQWAGSSLAAIILQGELRFLRHRASAAVTSLLFAA
jgi:hypothetical protein